MSTVGIEIGELNVHSFVRKDTYGLFYTGAERSSQKTAPHLGAHSFRKTTDQFGETHSISEQYSACRGSVSRKDHES